MWGWFGVAQRSDSPPAVLAKGDATETIFQRMLQVGTFRPEHLERLMLHEGNDDDYNRLVDWLENIGRTVQSRLADVRRNAGGDPSMRRETQVGA